jgi:hypothetical protein
MTGFAIDRGDAALRAGSIRTLLTDSRIPVLALLAIIAMQFPLIWQRSINWDEFYHYAHVVELSHGTLDTPLQTLQARMFLWVLHLPGNGIDHIIVIRSVMFAFELLAAISIAGIAARFTDKTTGIIAAAAYIGGGFVFQHGFSFRADPMLAGLLMASLWLLLCTRVRAATLLLTALLLGIALMVSIKIVLFAPAFAGIAWLRWHEQGRPFSWIVRMAVLVIAALAFAAAIYFAHASDLAGNTTMVAASVVNNSAESMFGFALPYQKYVFKQILLVPVLAAFVIFFPAALLRSSLSLHERIALAGLFVPVLTLFFYRNALPYYYTFMLPPVVAAISIVISEFRTKFGTLLVSSLFLISAFLTWTKEDDAAIGNQRTVLTAAETIFPDKVAYIDFCGYLGSFPKANAFLTSWGIELYKAGRYPSIREILASRPVPLVMSNHPMFGTLFKTTEDVPDLLPQDAAAMRATYIQLWGPYWIAGKEISASAGETDVVLLVPGPYTVRGGSLQINGKVHGDGEVVMLSRGKHQIASMGTDAKLIWGKRIVAPKAPAPAGPYWTPF